jgi:class 3 adenylate cyclase
LPAFLNTVFGAVETCISGGSTYWDEDDKLTALKLRAAQRKFMGDGALYILLPPEGESSFSKHTITALCNRLWNLKNGFDEVLKKCADDVPVFDLPPRIRFGIARGSVFELLPSSGEASEYVGFCINLASRLQKYCPTLDFIASARLGIDMASLSQYGYTRVVAKAIRGFPKEIVFVDKEELDEMTKDEKEKLFEIIEGDGQHANGADATVLRTTAPLISALAVPKNRVP